MVKAKVVGANEVLQKLCVLLRFDVLSSLVSFVSFGTGLVLTTVFRRAMLFRQIISFRLHINLLVI